MLTAVRRSTASNVFVVATLRASVTAVSLLSSLKVKDHEPESGLERAMALPKPARV